MTELNTVSLSGLLMLEDSELAKLISSVINQGFFYLVLDASPKAHVLIDVDDCLQAAKVLYDLPLIEKLQYDIDKLDSHRLNG